MEHNFLKNRKTIDPANRYRANQFDRKSERPDEGQDQHVFHNVKRSDIISKARKDRKTAEIKKENKELKYIEDQFDRKSERPDEGQDQHVCGNLKPSDIMYIEDQFDRKSERPDEGQDQHVCGNLKPSDIISKARKDRKTAEIKKENKELKYIEDQFDRKSERPDEGQDQHVCGNLKPSDIISKARKDRKTAEIKKENKELKEAIKKLKEDISSLKDKVAKEVALSIKTGQTESLYNPVSQARLKEMYDDLRLRWPAIKKHLESNKEKPDTVRVKIQDAFENAKSKVSDLRQQMNKLIDEENLSDEVLQKLTQLKQSAAQDFQLALYHTRNHVYEVLDQKCTSINTEDIMKDLLSECSWLGQLMALNNPTIQPDWENHTPGKDTWHILPKNLCSKAA
ncbi:uncharacterized protein LOC119798381 isoform X2 [Cyprinodon tularosa]|uniref:uncharacterized protein LOC119798381 isoform X2 n=1 Tax=Cyprinodon tularosa TaxID=77115 RepID=UPI0018E1DF86|nr:uncharacterized protein LOC119798381 isoform X2 [Cyprinodon tularosa]